MEPIFNFALELGSKSSLFITFVEKEGPFLKIWGQTQRSLGVQVEQAMHDVITDSETNDRELSSDLLNNGVLCCVKFSDNKYYRGRITSTNYLNEGLVEVNFLDVGNKNVVPRSNLRSLHGFNSYFISLPPLANSYILSEAATATGVWNESVLQEICKELIACEASLVVTNIAANRTFIRLSINNLDVADNLFSRRLMMHTSRDTQETVLLSMFPQQQLRQQPLMRQQQIRQQQVVVRQPQQIRQQPQIVHHPSLPVNSYAAPVPVMAPVIAQPPPPTQQQTLLTYKAYSLESGSKHAVYVSYITDGPCHFSIQLKQTETALVKLMSDINSMPLHPLEECPIPGTVCVARCIEDSNICRAVVTNEVDRQFKVFYVDFGNSEIVPLEALYQIPFKHIIPKVMAIRFSLAGVEKPTVTLEMKCAFKQFVDNRLLGMHVLQSSAKTALPRCELWDPATKESALDVVLAAAIQAYPEPLVLSRGFSQEVRVSYVYSCSRFYVQLKSKQEELLSLMLDLQESCRYREAIRPETITVGLPCCALFETDNQWYRSKVVEVGPNDMFKVRYVDYGNEEYVPSIQLRPIEGEELTVLRPQAIECSMNGYQNMAEDVERDGFLEEIILEKDFLMKVIEMQNNRVLIDLIDSNSYNVASLLLEKMASARAQTNVLLVQANHKIEHKKVGLSPPNKSYVDQNQRRDQSKTWNERNNEQGNWRHENRDRNNRETNEYSSEGNWRQNKGSNASENFERGNKQHGKENVRQSEVASPDTWETKSNYSSTAHHKSDKFQNNRVDTQADVWNDNTKTNVPEDSLNNASANADNYSESKDSRGFRNRDNFNDRPERGGYKNRNNWGDGDKADKRGSDFDRREKKDNWDRKGRDDGGSWEKKRDDGGSWEKKRDDGGSWEKKRDDGDSWEKKRDDGGSWEKKRDDGGSWEKKRDDGASWEKKNNNWDKKEDGHRKKDTDWENKDSWGDNKDFKRDSSDRGQGFNRKPREGGEFRRDDDKFGRRNDSGQGYKKNFRRENSELSSSGSEKGSRKGPWSGENKFKKFDKPARDSFSFGNTAESTEVAEVFDAAPASATYKVPEVEPNSEHSVSISWFHNPSSFYIQLSDTETSFKTMMEEIQEAYKKRKCSTAVVNSPVISIFPEDSVLYRAKVLEVSGSCYKVFYVDFGNVAKVDKVWPIETKFMEIPAQAILCGLDNVEPVNEEWEDAKSYEEYFNKEHYQCTFINVDETGRYLIEMGYGEDRISELLEKNCLVRRQMYIPLSIPLLVGQCLKVTLISVTSLEEILVSLDSGETLICSIYKLEEATEIFKETLDTYLEIPVLIQINQIVDQKLSVVFYESAFGSLIEVIKPHNVDSQILTFRPCPVLRDQLGGCVSHVRDNVVCVQPFELLDSLVQLQSSMYDYYESGTVDPVQPQEDFFYAIKDEELWPRWYRVRCFGSGPDEDNMISVIYMDYGMKEKVPIDKMWELAPEFMVQEMCCVPFLFDKPLDDYLNKNVLVTGIQPKEDPLKPEFRCLQINHTTKKIYSVSLENCYGMDYEVSICHFETPGEIYINLVTEQADLEYLQNKIGVQASILKKVPAEIGKWLLATWSEDGMWYRAEVLEIGDETSQVRFIDFGNTAEVKNDHFKELPEEFQDTEPFAKKVKLRLNPVGTEWDKETFGDVVKEIKDRQDIVRAVFSEDHSPYVELYVEGQNLRDFIVYKNLAIYDPLDGRWMTLSHVENPCKFYIQFNSELTRIDEMQSDLQTEIKDMTIVESPAVGTLCAAKYAEDDQWYRAEVMNIESDKLTVKFVDYGNTETVPHNVDSVRVLPDKFVESFRIPAALLVGLADIAPTEHEWSQEAIDKFKEVTTGNIFGYFKKHENGIDYIDLFNEQENIQGILVQSNLSNLAVGTGPSAVESQSEVIVDTDNVDLVSVTISHIDSPNAFYIQLTESFDAINEILDRLQTEVPNLPDLDSAAPGALCAAQYSLDEVWYRAKVLDADDDITTVRFIDYGNTDVLSNETAKVKTLPSDLLSLAAYATLSSLKISPVENEWSAAAIDFFNESINTEDLRARFIDQDEKTNYVDLYADGKSVKDALVGENLAVATDSELEDSNSGFVSHMNSPSEFWIQLHNCINELEWFSEQLTGADKFPELEDLSPGTLCAALYSDHQWYRARILSNTVAGIEVLFIDFGNSSISSNLRQLPEDMVMAPPLAQKCSLKKPEGIVNWPQLANEKFNQIAADGQTIFTVDKLSTGETAIVRLLLDGEDIVEKLLPAIKTGTVVEASSLDELTIRIDGEICGNTYRLEPLPGLVWDEDSLSKFKEINNEGQEFEIEFIPDEVFVRLYINGNDIRTDIGGVKGTPASKDNPQIVESEEFIAATEEGVMDSDDQQFDQGKASEFCDTNVVCVEDEDDFVRDKIVEELIQNVERDSDVKDLKTSLSQELVENTENKIREIDLAELKNELAEELTEMVEHGIEISDTGLKMDVSVVNLEPQKEDSLNTSADCVEFDDETIEVGDTTIDDDTTNVDNDAKIDDEITNIEDLKIDEKTKDNCDTNKQESENILDASEKTDLKDELLVNSSSISTYGVEDKLDINNTYVDDTILEGSSGQEVVQVSDERYSEVNKEVEEILRGALDKALDKNEQKVITKKRLSPKLNIDERIVPAALSRPHSPLPEDEEPEKNKGH